ncbi:MAG: hypothetical protein U0736_02565 [Gemmataceae bacterium]
MKTINLYAAKVIDLSLAVLPRVLRPAEGRCERATPRAAAAGLQAETLGRSPS